MDVIHIVPPLLPNPPRMDAEVARVEGFPIAFEMLRNMRPDGLCDRRCCSVDTGPR